MKSLRIILLLSLSLLCANSFAQKTTFTMQAPQQVIQGKKFNVTLRVSNGNSVSTPPTPDIKNCTYIYGPVPRETQSYQIINGNASSTHFIDYTFTYRADKAGQTTIPAVTTTIDGKTMSTTALQMQILPPDKDDPSDNSNSNGRPQVDTDAGKLADISSDDMFIRVILDKSSVYEQEAIVATVKIYSRYNISSFRTIAQPTFDGFFSEEIPVQSNGQTEHYNGKNYFSCVLRKCVLYPQKPGQLKISSGEYELTIVQHQPVRIGFHIDYRPVETPVTTKTNSATVNVRPLPTPKPTGFNGAVGSFTATASMNPLELRSNEVSSYIYQIEGTGNIKFLTAPTLTLPAGVDKLTPKTDINASFTGNDMKGSFTTNFSLIPQNPGDVTIPEQKFVYFNPKDEEYHTVDIPPFTLKVIKGANISSGTEQMTIAKGMTDILHIKPLDNTLSHSKKYIFRSFIYWCCYAISLVALVAIIFIYRSKLRKNADIIGRKRARANKQASKRLRVARALMQKHETDKFFIELNQALSGYLSDKLNIPASGLMRENISAKLSELDVPENVITDAIDVLDECEMARFASTNSDSEVSNLLEKAENTIRAIDQHSKSNKKALVQKA